MIFATLRNNRLDIAYYVDYSVFSIPLINCFISNILLSYYTTPYWKRHIVLIDQLVPYY